MRSIDDHVKRFEVVEADRNTWDSHWQQIRDNVSPDTARFTGEDTVGVRNRYDLDMTAEAASIYLAGTMHAWLANPGTEWFRLRLVDDDLMENDEARMWIEEAGRRVLNRLESPLSGFHAGIDPFLRQFCDMGTSGMFIGLPNGLAVVEPRPLVETYIVETRRGVRDTIYRKWKPTAYEIASAYPETCPDKIKAEAGGSGFMTRHTLIHVIEPNPDGRPGALKASNLPISELVFSLDFKVELARGGYHEHPLPIATWSQRVGEVYGRGPGMQALPHQIMVNRAERVILRGAEKVVDPPLEIPDQGMAGRVSMQPNAINFTKRELWGQRVRNVIVPIETHARPDIGEALLDRHRAAIERAYLVPYIAAAQDPRMTATQVIKLEEETLRLVAPFLGGLFSQLLEPLVTRTFNGMLRGGWLGQPPAVLAGRGFAIDWESPMIKARNLAEVRGILRLIGEVGPSMAQYDPDVMDNVNFDEAFRLCGRWLGVPERVMNTMRMIKELRDARNQAAATLDQRQQMGAEAAAAQQTAQAVGSLAGAAATANDNARAEAVA